VDFLKPFLTKKIQSQKEVVVIVLAQLIFSCLYLEEFVEEEGEFFQDFKQFEEYDEYLNINFVVGFLTS